MGAQLLPRAPPRAAVRSLETHTDSVHRLLTFGGLSLMADGHPVTGAASQRSRLALLAMLARAGSTGISRDKVLAALWPESDHERARHALKQAVYSLRRDLHSETAITGTASLALDPAFITSDVRDFDDALARGDDEAAVALYAGPFLDGVFLRNAPEFDRWSDGDRAALRQGYLAACERLAVRDAGAGQHTDAIRWWRLAAAADPLSGRIALALMHALAVGGDLTGALRHASVHEELVRNELDSPPDDAVLALAANLRSGAWKPPRISAAVAAPIPNAVASASVPVTGVSRPATPASPLVRSPSRPVRLWPWLLGATVAAAIALSAIFFSVPPERRGTLRTLVARGRPTLSPTRIVVAPFTNRTGDSTLDPLGQLTADWLARSLLEANFEVVDSRTSAIASRLLASLPGLLLPRDAVVALAEETGAGTVLTGSYYKEGDTLQFEVSVADVARGTVARTVGPLRGRASEATKLVARLASRVAASLAASTDSTAGAQTAALALPPSLEAFEHTSRAWEMFFSRPADTAAVFAELDRATATDSMYSAPLLMRAYVLDVKSQWVALEKIVRRLQPRRHALSRTEQAALDMFEADLRGDLVGRLRASRQLARLSPGSVDMALLVAVSASYLLRPREALDALAASDPDRGVNLVSPMYWAWRAAAAHELQAYDEERMGVREGARRFPSEPVINYARVRAAAVIADLREIDLIVSSAARSSSEAGDLMQLGGRELRAHGHATEAATLFARAANQSPPRPNASREDRHRHALALYEADRLPDARRAYASLLAADSADLVALGRLGSIAARTRDTAELSVIDRRLAGWSAPFAFGEAKAWRAHAAALTGRSADAVAFLRSAVAEGFRPFDLGEVTVHSEGDFLRLRADPRFRDFAAPHTGPVKLP